LAHHCPFHRAGMAVCLDVWRFGGGSGGTDAPLCRLDVTPEVDTAKSLKASIAGVLGVPSHRQRLVPVGSITVLDGPEPLKECCDVAAGVQLVVIDVEELPNEHLRLPFDDARRLGAEVVSGQLGEFLHAEQMRAVAVQGRRGIEFSGRCTLRLPVQVELGAQWTISFWTLAPVDSSQTWRNLLDGAVPDSCIAVCLQEGRIGDYAAQRWLEGFHVSTLPEGWHHFAAVGAEGSTTYYLDGSVLGQLAVQTRGTVGAVGNRGDGRVPEAFGVVSDLRIFGAAARLEQVQELAVQQPGTRDARRDLLELTLMM